jgi:hypothetical protein
MGQTIVPALKSKVITVPEDQHNRLAHLLTGQRMHKDAVKGQNMCTRRQDILA